MTPAYFGNGLRLPKEVLSLDSYQNASNRFANDHREPNLYNGGQVSKEIITDLSNA